MALAPVRLIVLDFDGVIIESNGVKTQAFRDVFSRFPEQLEATMGFHAANAWKSRYEKIDFLLRELGRPNDTALRQELADAFSRRTLDLLETVPYVTGAEAFLAEFSSRVPLYLASITPQADLDLIVDHRGLRRYFRAVYGGPPWSKADAVRDALRREQCEPANAVLVGDAPGDRDVAIATGVDFVARKSEIPFDPPVPVSHPDLVAVADILRPRLR